MSVTSLVRNRNFIMKLREIYPQHRIKPKNAMVVSSTTQRASHIGTAFDYLLRVLLARHHKFKYPHLSWEVDYITTELPASNDNYSTRNLRFGVVDEPVVVRRDGFGAMRHIWAIETLARAKSLTLEFHEKGIVTDELVWAMFQISYLEMVVRSGKLELLNPYDLQTPDPAAINELKCLAAAAEKQAMLQASTDLYLCPRLRADYLTRGASPDILIDGWVCDIKVASSLSDTPRWIDQLLIYAAIIDIGGLDLLAIDHWKANFYSIQDKKINGVAVYFARHAEWQAIELRHIITKSQFKDLQKLLCEEYLGSKNSIKIQELRRAIKRNNFW